MNGDIQLTIVVVVVAVLFAAYVMSRHADTTKTSIEQLQTRTEALERQVEELQDRHYLGFERTDYGIEEDEP